MGEGSTIGVDLAKSVFQVHGADASGAVLFRRKLRRHRVLTFFAAQLRCTVAVEACGGSHHWARETGGSVANSLFTCGPQLSFEGPLLKGQRLQELATVPKRHLK